VPSAGRAVSVTEKDFAMNRIRLGQDSRWLLAVVLGTLLPSSSHAREINDRETLQAQAALSLRLHQQGKDVAALAVAQRVVAASEKLFGPNSLDTAQHLNSLGVICYHLGQYARAEPLYQRSLAILEAILGKDHPDVANRLSNLAELYRAMEQPAKAEPLLLRSLAIREAKLGKDHLDVANSLHNLSLLYWSMGQYGRAEPLGLRSLAILEARLGKDHLLVASSLNNLARICRAQGQYARAEPLLLRSLAIREAQLGKDHPAVATTLNHLGVLYKSMDQPARAEPYYQRCLTISEARLGPEHPYVLTDLNNLAELEEAADQTGKAVALFERARRGSRRYVAQILPVLSEAEQATFLNQAEQRAFHKALALGLRHAREEKLTACSAAWLLNGKAVAQQSLAEAALLTRDRSDTALADLTQQLRQLRQQLAQLTLITAKPGQEGQLKQQREELSRREQELARRLRQAGGRAGQNVDWVELDDLRRSLPPDAVFIDLVRCEFFDFQARADQRQWLSTRYAAWITPPQGEVRLLDLGPAAPNESAVKAVRQALAAAPTTIRRQGEPDSESETRQLLDALSRRVLQPLLPHVADSRRWFLSPDSDLWLVPWAALTLPNGKYAVEDHTISYVVSGRDLVHASRRARVQTQAPLVLADPDFDLGLDQAAVETRKLLRGQELPSEARGLSQALHLGSIARLPGTAAEAEAVAPKLKQFAGAEPRLYTDKQALAGVFQAARNPRVVVLSTHGFVLPDQDNGPTPGERRSAEANNRRSPSTSNWENPLLRCGLLLAGCNNAAQAKEGEDNGVLTGLQIVGTDLRGCELVVLSACETGLGDVRNGEGVAGLRQAFQLAGAESVVATLWQIPDQQSAQLMIKFFDNLANKQSKADALRNAQLDLIKARREKNAAAHPFFWAAFTLTGQ